MPRLLTPRALGGPLLWPRWAVIAAAAALALVPAARLAADVTPVAFFQEADRFDWDADQIQAAIGAPASHLTDRLPDGTDARGAALTAHVDGEPLVVAAAWDRDLTVTAIRVETYTDRHGAGLRLGVTAWADTAEKTRCLAAAVIGDPVRDSGDTIVSLCLRADNQPQADTYPGRGDTGDTDWEPTHLYLSQTAELIPATTDAMLFDYIGIGADTGDPYESGLWRTWWSPMDYGEPYGRWRWSCGADTPIVDLTADPDYGSGLAPPVADAPAPPLPVSACAPIADAPGRFSTGPFIAAEAAALSGWTRYNDATLGRPQPLQLAFVADLRTCDTAPGRCHTDTGPEWMRELSDLDR
ncbi:hypothetical protein LO763_16065 [Glycomyces sp. A-F 0318]|uniref:hypothetical protein n=1 Tax=Glycomyces amatae TaxID=2881355 RepID=UPI001E32D0E6|nr:hypothetical protein [Glycomyces amatae]MCD0445133.1 hypothetical protein [Glycomyces amatae]